MSSPPQLWDGVVRRLGAELPAFVLEAWIRPLVPETREQGLCLLCPTPFHRERVLERHLAAIRRCAELEAGAPVEIDLDLCRTPHIQAVTPPATKLETHATLATTPQSGGAEASRSELRRAVRPAQREFSYSFDEFVVGPCNALAREAALAVAHDRQRGANPLYLASDLGLGKTHLAQSIVQETRQRGDVRTLYGSAEGFTNRFLSSIRNKRMDDFKRRFRERCDLLVLEDVQFLSSKTATQLELFHTVAHLLDSGARIVLTGDRLPRDIGNLDARLRSQMTAGFVAELEAPDLRVRREILARKAARGGVRLPDDCLDLLAETLRGSVRDLEGVLIQLVASASLLDRPVDLELTRAALRKIEPAESRPRRLRPDVVIAVVAAFFQTAPEALASRSRRRDVLVPRQLAMYLCHRFTDQPLSAIARAFGREHPAAANAVKVMERRILERAPVRYQVEALTTRLAALERSGRRGADE